MLAKRDMSGNVHKAVLGHLKDRLDAAAISTASATRAVRLALPGCRLTDRELADLVAETAIEAGFGVSFESVPHSSDNDNAEPPI